MSYLRVKAHILMFANRGQGMIASHNRLGAARECAFQNAIVALVLYHSWSSSRLDEDDKVRQKYGDVGELFGIARKFVSEDAEQLIEHRLGDYELVVLLDGPQCCFTSPA